MSSAKERIAKILQDQPDDSSYDEILQKLIFVGIVERGLADADAGRTISHKEMKCCIDAFPSRTGWVEAAKRSEPGMKISSSTSYHQQCSHRRDLPDLFPAASTNNSKTSSTPDSMRSPSAYRRRRGELVELRDQPQQQFVARLHHLGNRQRHLFTPHTLPNCSRPWESEAKG